MRIFCTNISIGVMLLTSSILDASVYITRDDMYALSNIHIALCELFIVALSFLDQLKKR